MGRLPSLGPVALLLLIAVHVDSIGVLTVDSNQNQHHSSLKAHPRPIGFHPRDRVSSATVRNVAEDAVALALWQKERMAQESSAPEQLTYEEQKKAEEDFYNEAVAGLMYENSEDTGERKPKDNQKKKSENERTKEQSERGNNKGPSAAERMMRLRASLGQQHKHASQAHTNMMAQARLLSKLTLKDLAGAQGGEEGGDQEAGDVGIQFPGEMTQLSESTPGYGDANSPFHWWNLWHPFLQPYHTGAVLEVESSVSSSSSHSAAMSSGSEDGYTPPTEKEYEANMKRFYDRLRRRSQPKSAAEKLRLRTTVSPRPRDTEYRQNRGQIPRRIRDRERPSESGSSPDSGGPSGGGNQIPQTAEFSEQATPYSWYQLWQPVMPYTQPQYPGGYNA